MEGINRCLAAVCLIALLSAPCLASAGTPASAKAEHKPKVDENVRGVVAGAVMVALTEKLHDSRIRIRLKSVTAASREGEAMNLEGVAEYQQANAAQWSSLHFSTRYLPAQESASYPILRFDNGADQPRLVLNDPRLISELEARIGQQMAADAGIADVREVRLQLDEIRSERCAGHLLTINIDARADIGTDTGRRARIEAAYDEAGKRWISTNYLFDVGNRLAGY